MTDDSMHNIIVVSQFVCLKASSFSESNTHVIKARFVTWLIDIANNNNTRRSNNFIHIMTQGKLRVGIG